VLKAVILKELGFQSEEDFKSDENPETAYRIQRRAKEAMARVSEMKGKIKAPESVDYEQKLQEQNAQRLKTTEALNPVIEKLVPNLQKYTFKENDEATPYEFDFDEETVKKSKQIVLNHMLNSPDPYSPETLNEALSIAHSIAESMNRAQIMSSFARNIRNMSEEEFRKRHSKPSAADPKLGEARKTGGENVESDSDAAYNMSMGKRR